MNYLREIFSGNYEKDYIHKRFIRYGRGNFLGPYLRIVKGKTINVTASYGFENILAYCLIKYLSSLNEDISADISGNIYSSEDITPELSFIDLNFDMKKKQRINIYKLSRETLSSEKIQKLLELFNDNDKIKKASLLLSIDSTKGKLKTKKSIPKPQAGLDKEFSKLSIPRDAENTLLDELVFSKKIEKLPDSIEIQYYYTFTKLIVPEEYVGNFSLARIHAKRAGTISREIRADGSVIKEGVEVEI